GHIPSPPNPTTRERMRTRLRKERPEGCSPHSWHTEAKSTAACGNQPQWAFSSLTGRWPSMGNSASSKAKRRVALIDADSIIFARAVMAERKVAGGGLDGDLYLQT